MLWGIQRHFDRIPVGDSVKISEPGMRDEKLARFPYVEDKWRISNV
jgi:hypothetical protein